MRTKILESLQQINAAPIVLMVAGSHMHGTATPQSDMDVRGVTFAPPATVVGLGQETENGRFKPFELWQDLESDSTVFSLAKYMHLLLKSSPTAIEMLFAPKDSRIHETAVWNDLLSIREDFLSSRMFNSFGGFAQGAWKSATTKSPMKSRKPIVEQYGYDPKYAAHAVRILQEGTELLLTGSLTYPRPNAGWLKSVKLGEVTFTAVCAAHDEAHTAFKDAATTTELPDRVSSSRVVALSMEANYQNLQRWSCGWMAKA